MTTSGILLEIVGLEELIDLVDDLTEVETILKKASGEINELLLDRMQDYPPELPGQRYVRTYRLQNSWFGEVHARGGVLGRVASTRVDYNHWVQDRRYQAHMHQGRWDTHDDVAEEEAEEAAAIVNEVVQERIDLVR